MNVAERMSVADVMEQSGVAFGTSGARGLVSAMTDRVCYAYTRGFLSYLAELGEFSAGDSVALAGDLRPSTPRIMRACAAAIRDAGGEPVNCGLVPTPALALYAMGHTMASLMVTGSHIPADRNGIKFYRPVGEVLKSDEAGMKQQVPDCPEGRFSSDGALAAPFPLGPVVDVLPEYVARYQDFFGKEALQGRHIGVYQHSAVGRDVVVQILEALGAKVTALGRSDTFIPVDTEAVRPEDQQLAAQWAQEFGFDAIASTDGDSDRPLLADHTGNWLRGDVLGVLCASQLGARIVATPVSSNTALEVSGRFATCLRTRIGSPYVIAAMQGADDGAAGLVCGFEANGGFLMQTGVEANGRLLTALPTRDAVLPIVAALVAAGTGSLDDLVKALPQRITFSDRLEAFSQALSQALFQRLLLAETLDARKADIDMLFAELDDPIDGLDLTDGVRCTFRSGAIAHLRASGNAPELRCYTEAGTEEEARALNARVLHIARQIVSG